MKTSKDLFERAQLIIPGGVNSPVRAFKSVGGTPVFFKEAKGAIMIDVEGKEYIDYIGSWGPMILGHAHPPVIEALKNAADKSTSFGTPTELETKIAELICTMMPCVDKLRMVNSGTEACMSAIRVARAYTKREKFIKFEGCYHGHADPFLIKAGSGAITLGVPSSPGITSGTAKDTLLARYNDVNHVEQILNKNKGEVAAIILEPVAGNMGCIPPQKDFLESLRKLCDKHGAVLIFDEVISGFRFKDGSYGDISGVTPDITALGKIIGGGLPVGAYGARSEIMEQLSPLGPVYQAGTLSGNPLAMTCGYTLLKELYEHKVVFEELEEKTQYLEEGMRRVFEKFKLTVCINRVGSMLSFHFNSVKVASFDDACAADADYFKNVFHGMLKRGVYLAPSAFETLFISRSHTKELLDRTLVALEETLQEIEA